MTQLAPSEDAVYSTLGRDPDLGSVVTCFVQALPSRIAGILEKASVADWGSLRIMAHQLKGAGGSYGFASISPAAARIEDAIVGQQPEEAILTAVDDLADLCRRVRAGGPD
jgi:HPt (histidine-containing phosphotransfer) domain-containing protein